MRGGELISKNQGKPDNENIYRALGSTLKRLRRDKGVTLRAVCDEIGISPGYLSQLENDRVGASFSVLLKLCQFYELSLSDLLRSLESQAPPIISRPGKRAAAMSGSHYLIEWLVSESSCAMQVDIVTMEPGASSGGTYSHGGEEFAFVLEGYPTLTVGDIDYRLSPEELLYYTSDSPHSWRNDGKVRARVLWCTTPPTM